MVSIKSVTKINPNAACFDDIKSVCYERWAVGDQLSAVSYQLFATMIICFTISLVYKTLIIFALMAFSYQVSAIGTAWRCGGIP